MYKNSILLLLRLIIVSMPFLFTACGGGSSGSAVDESAVNNDATVKTTLYNREATIPSQCYTRTESQYNPCYTCHQSYSDARANAMNDGDLQGDYSFSWLGVENHWSNLFKDRTQAIEAIADQKILDYVAQDNYSSLAASLKKDAKWTGYVPDLSDYQLSAAAFDDQGLARDNSGWVAFNYKPLPSTFWPTNGSTDDVVLRLPSAFRTSSCGDGSTQSAGAHDVYFANLALLEATIMGDDKVGVPLIDENNICVDLNGDGKYSEINEITQLPTHYVGQASNITRHNGLYPLGTEFLHSVRYVGVTSTGDIFTPPRMKELRYMKKTHFFTAGELKGAYALDEIAKEDEIIPTYKNTGVGMVNSYGWLVLGFIEDQHGALRQQTHEENKFCMGCHSTIGTTIDQTFAFPRKVSGAQGWGYINLKGMRDVPSRGETDGEILTYLQRVGGGSEFRANDEMQQRWFNADMSIKDDAIKAADVYDLITPSRQRALMLNKAYKVIVDEQSFIYGRDAVVKIPENVYHRVPTDKPPLAEGKQYQWDIRLSW